MASTAMFADSALPEKVQGCRPIRNVASTVTASGKPQPRVICVAGCGFDACYGLMV
jgi:hypothetical protein